MVKGEKIIFYIIETYHSIKLINPIPKDKFSERVENAVGKGGYALRAISSFPTVFSRLALQTYLKKDLFEKKVLLLGDYLFFAA